MTIHLGFVCFWTQCFQNQAFQTINHLIFLSINPFSNLSSPPDLQESFLKPIFDIFEEGFWMKKYALVFNLSSQAAFKFLFTLKNSEWIPKEFAPPTEFPPTLPSSSIGANTTKISFFLWTLPSVWLFLRKIYTLKLKLFTAPNSKPTLLFWTESNFFTHENQN